MRRTITDYMTWRAMSGSGVRISMTKNTTRSALTKTPLVLTLVIRVLFGVVRG